LLNDITDYPYCVGCGVYIQPIFYKLKNGYKNSRFCSPACSSRSDDIKQTKKYNFKEIHGVYHHMQLSSTKSKIKQTNLDRYGVENTFQSDEIKDKIKQNRLEQTGYEYASQNPEIRKKIQQTNLDRYGVDNPRKSNVTVDKIKQTNQERYGYDSFLISPEGQQQRLQTTLEKYGVEYALQSPEIQQNKNQTCLAKYGVNHPMQTTTVFEKCGKYKNKQLNLPSGKSIRYQGYENVAITHLLLEVGEEDIKNQRGEVPSIWYIIDDTTHRYYPDIYIPSKNLIVEVKSTWTYKKHFDINQLKKQTCIEQGYNFEFWICSNKKILEIIR
jgi:hypothetical protein